MAIIKFRPVSNGLRTRVSLNQTKLLTANPDKPRYLHKSKNIQSGRNNQGKITVRHHVGGHKAKYRIIDFARNKYNVPGRLATIEYDPNRNALISLIVYQDGEKRYILTPKTAKINDEILASETKISFNVGNSMRLMDIPEGMFVHNIELKPNARAKLVRAAGSFAQILGKDETGNFCIIKLPSGEYRKIPAICQATIGAVGNEEVRLVRNGKAGRTLWKGRRPHVRGAAMNPNDHPHGGGEGRAPVGRKSPLTPWGKKALGVKTRDKKKASSQYIMRSRNYKNK